MKVLVTGGAGFIGSNYVRRVVDGSLSGVSSLIVLDKLTYAGSLSNLDSIHEGQIEFIVGDICDEGLVRNLTARVDAIINFAAESHVDRSINNPQVFTETNILGVQTLLEAARLSKIKKFVQISTDEVYGSISTGSWLETNPLLPNSPYAASKAAADLLVRAYHKTFGLNVSITRCSNNYGRSQFPEKLIPLIITNLIDNLRIPIYGTGQNVRDWIHVDDHCAAVHSVLFEGLPGESYNIGGGNELTNINLARQILHFLNKDETLLNFVPDRLGHDFRYSVNTEKILSELKFRPKVNIRIGLEKTINWYVENELWWRPLKRN